MGKFSSFSLIEEVNLPRTIHLLLHERSLALQILTNSTSFQVFFPLLRYLFHIHSEIWFQTSEA